MKSPSVDIIIPVYNCEAYLEDAFASIREQSYPSEAIRVIAVDDGSTDGSARVLRRIADRSDVSTDILALDTNSGANRARNLALAHSDAEFVYFMDADSLLLRNAIERYVAELVHNPDPCVGFAYSAFGRLWETRGQDYRVVFEPVQPGAYSFVRLCERNYISMMSMVRREALLATGFDESLRRFQDWDLWLTLGARGIVGTEIDEVLFYAYVREAGTSADQEGIEAARAVVSSKHLGGTDRIEIHEHDLARFTGERPSVSVVLGVYNQASILEQTLPVWRDECIGYEGDAELIVCDDGSPDNTAQVVSGFAQESLALGFRATYLRQENVGKARLAENLNQALDHLSGAYTLFAMGDSYPKPGLLDAYAPHVEPDRILTGLRMNVFTLFKHDSTRPDHRAKHLNYLEIHKNPRPWEGFTGNNFMIPTELLKRIGGWNPGFQGYGAEDWELAMYAHFAEGAALLAVPNAIVYHVIHEERAGSGDPNWHLAKWVSQLNMRYATGDYSRDTAGLWPDPPDTTG